MMPRVGTYDPEAYAASRERSRARREAQRAERRRRRRRLFGVGGAAGLAFLIGALLGSGSGGSTTDETKAAAAPKVPLLPGGGTRIFPGRRVVAFYGTSGTAALGTLGKGSPAQAARRLVKQARGYARGRGKVLPAFEFIATVASSSPGDDGKYRNTRPLSEVRRYLRAVRRIHGLLVIDVQPGQADFFDEVQRYAPLLREPDVSLALDPEWKMLPGEIPGQVIGHTDAATVNRVSGWLGGIVRANHLPQKLLLVHLFTAGMVRNRAAVLRRKGLAITFNVDGYGDQPNKKAKYRELRPRGRRLFPGFKLFYKQDSDILTPRQVMRLRPAPVYVDYQ